MKVLITGIAGFIGSHLADVFLERGFKVIGIDNFITGLKENIKHLFSNKNFQFINHDICNEIVINSDLDCILHFASPASPKDYLKYPIKTLQIGSLGTENVLKTNSINLMKGFSKTTLFVDTLIEKNINNIRKLC